MEISTLWFQIRTNDLLAWYANNGSESFTKNIIDNSGMTDIYDVEVGDIDGDGDKILPPKQQAIIVLQMIKLYGFIK